MTNQTATTPQNPDNITDLPDTQSQNPVPNTELAISTSTKSKRKTWLTIFGVVVGLVGLIVIGLTLYGLGSASRGIKRLNINLLENRIAGTWQLSDGAQITFSNKNTFEVKNEIGGLDFSGSGFYSFYFLEDQTFIVIQSEREQTHFDIKFSGNTVTLTDKTGESVTMTRKK